MQRQMHYSLRKLKIGNQLNKLSKLIDQMVKFCAKVQQQPLLHLAEEEATRVNKISLDTEELTWE